MPIPEGDPLILVTGASGYVAVHVIKLLQTKGYRVRGTLRSLKDKQKTQSVLNLCPDARTPLELVEADLMKDEGWLEAVKGCTYVMHVASPFVASWDGDEQDLIKPAVEGTLRVLKAAKTLGTVKRVIVTSSVYANLRYDTLVTESTWMDPDYELTKTAYHRSKYYAEKAAWEFMETLKENERFEMSTVNPGFIIGPPLRQATGESINFTKNALEGKFALPHVSFYWTSLEDIAEAHYKAMITPEAAGKRCIIGTQVAWVDDVGKMLRDEYASQGYDVKIDPNPDPNAKELRVDNTRMKNMYGMMPITLKQMFLSMVNAMIKSGQIQPNTSTQNLI